MGLPFCWFIVPVYRDLVTEASFSGKLEQCDKEGICYIKKQGVTLASYFFLKDL